MIRFFFVIILSLGFTISYAQEKVYEIDLTQETALIRYGHLVQQATNSDGETLDVNSRYFVRNDRPWFPVMGEFHYNRYPHQYWEEEIIKMKSGGLSIVATYVFWNAHENPKGSWNWEDNLNLREFVQLCQKHDMYVWLRIGPWSHGEQLHGGFPEWIQKLPGRRSNDPKYLKYAKSLYEEIGIQTKGLFFKDGGPIIGTQLENEFASGDPDHIGTLKQMAFDAGIIPVYFTITANTVFHDREFEAIPLQGAYPYRGWEKGGGKATKDFIYANDQWIMTDALGKVYYDVTQYPKGLCEQGCGSQMTFKNRFTVEPHVVEAHLQNQIGRGMNQIGYYMFQGGTQMPGLKEPGYPESYDFQAPISEFGLLRPSYKYLKILHHFINDFGADLAETFVYEPEYPVLDEQNIAQLRYIVRAKGNSGFVFLNNTQVRIPMPDKQFRIKLNVEKGPIEFPRKELTLQGETNAVLPFNYNLNGILLKYATAQPVSRFTVGDEHILVLTEVRGMDLELAFDASTVEEIQAEHWKIEKENGMIYLVPKGEIYDPVKIIDIDGGASQIIFLSREQAENCWRVKIGGQESIVLTEADLLIDQGEIEFRQLNNSLISFEIFPSPNVKLMNDEIELLPTNNGEFKIDLEEIEIDLEINPGDEPTVDVMLPDFLPTQLEDIILNIDYWGGGVTATLNDKVVTDHLLHGPGWQFGLKRYIAQGNNEIQFEIQDWSKSITGIPDEVVKEIKVNGSKFKEIKAIPQYRAKIYFGGRQ